MRPARTQGAPGLRHRDRRDREVPPRVGVREVHRRPDRGRLLAPGPVPRLRRRHHVLGARRDGPDARRHRRDRRPGASRDASSPRPSREYVADTEERRWIEPRLGAPARAGGRRRAGEREELFAAWRTFFERIAEHGTTVMVFEDLQWADGGAARLHRVDARVVEEPADPDRHARPARARGPAARTGAPDQRSFTAFHLEPLPDDAMTELVDGFVRGLPPDGVDRIVDRAEGVPLYAVETVRMLADRGVLRGADRRVSSCSARSPSWTSRPPCTR